MGVSRPSLLIESTNSMITNSAWYYPAHILELSTKTAYATSSISISYMQTYLYCIE